jgi:hypothetical protein
MSGPATRTYTITTILDQEDGSGGFTEVHTHLIVPDGWWVAEVSLGRFTVVSHHPETVRCHSLTPVYPTYLYLSPEPFAIVVNPHGERQLEDLTVTFARQIHKGELTGVVQTPRLPAMKDSTETDDRLWVNLDDLARSSGLSVAHVLLHTAFLSHGWNSQQERVIPHQLVLRPGSVNGPAATDFPVSYRQLVAERDNPDWTSFWVPLSFAKMVQRLRTLGFNLSDPQWRIYTA